MTVLTLTTQADRSQVLSITPSNTSSTLRGRIQIPGDKSISHRSLMLGAIASGETVIEGILIGEDPQSTAQCFREMGVEISPLNPDRVVVQGIGLEHLQEPKTVLDAGNSGTTLRLMLGLLAAQVGKFFSVTGDASLRSRPMSRVVKPLQSMGAQIWGRQNASLAPLAVQGMGLKPTHYHSPIASAQVKSCVLLAGLLTEGETIVTEPALSRDHSERMLRAFGAAVQCEPDSNTVILHGPATLRGQSVVVPGDISSAAFWIVAAAIVPGAEVVVENVGVNPTRTGVLEILEAMGADLTLEQERVVAGEPVADVRVRCRPGAWPLQACRIEGEVIPRLIDEIPILAVAATFAQGTTSIRDAAELRVKESDRLAVMAQQLTQMGAQVTEYADGLDIVGSGTLHGAELDSFTDHRIAMSLAIAALRATSVTHIARAEAASISYPDFVATLDRLIS